VIIDDATQTWPAMKELTVKNLFQVCLLRIIEIIFF
jgi:hypothetical protein